MAGWEPEIMGQSEERHGRRTDINYITDSEIRPATPLNPKRRKKRVLEALSGWPSNVLFQGHKTG